jgi:hypothetical protein
MFSASPISPIEVQTLASSSFLRSRHWEAALLRVEPIVGIELNEQAPYQGGSGGFC